MRSGNNIPSARDTAFPSAPEEESTCCNAGHNRSHKATTPSAAATGEVFATLLISATASPSRLHASADPFQPKAPVRKCRLNCQMMEVGMA